MTNMERYLAGDPRSHEQALLNPTEPSIPLSTLRDYLQWFEAKERNVAPSEIEDEYVDGYRMAIKRAKAELLARIPALKETT